MNEEREGEEDRRGMGGEEETEKAALERPGERPRRPGPGLRGQRGPQVWRPFPSPPHAEPPLSPSPCALSPPSAKEVEQLHLACWKKKKKERKKNKINPQTRALQAPHGRSKALEMVKNTPLNNSSDLKCLSLGKRGGGLCWSRQAGRLERVLGCSY